MNQGFLGMNDCLGQGWREQIQGCDLGTYMNGCSKRLKGSALQSKSCLLCASSTNFKPKHRYSSLQKAPSSSGSNLANVVERVICTDVWKLVWEMQNRWAFGTPTFLVSFSFIQACDDVYVDVGLVPSVRASESIDSFWGCGPITQRISLNLLKASSIWSGSILFLKTSRLRRFGRFVAFNHWQNNSPFWSTNRIIVAPFFTTKSITFAPFFLLCVDYLKFKRLIAAKFPKQLFKNLINRARFHTRLYIINVIFPKANWTAEACIGSEVHSMFPSELPTWLPSALSWYRHPNHHIISYCKYQVDTLNNGWGFHGNVSIRGCKLPHLHSANSWDSPTVPLGRSIPYIRDLPEI